MSVELPCRLGPFTLLRHLASGGMGEVYLAHEPRDDAPRLCVVKTVRAEYASDRVATRRFVDEARTSALLAHHNIVAVYDVGEDAGTPYIAVEYVPGRDLMAIFVAARGGSGAVPEAVCLYLIAELLDALDYAHHAADPRTGEPLHVVHRDVSPQNVLVAFDGSVKLIDFGIARCAVRSELTHVGQLVGKLRYISPEQARGEPVGPATDVWAACVTACELLTGQRFWGDRRPEAIAPLLAVGARVDPPGFSALALDVQGVLAPGFDPDAERRPSAAQLRDRLRAIVAERGLVDQKEHAALLLERLFVGEREREQQARATVLDEPSVVHAAAMPDRTCHEPQPDDSAPTVDERPGTAPAIGAVRPDQHRHALAFEPTLLSSTRPTPTARPVPLRRSRHPPPMRLVPAAGLAAAVTVVVVAWAAMPGPTAAGDEALTHPVVVPTVPAGTPMAPAAVAPVNEVAAPPTAIAPDPPPSTAAPQPVATPRSPHKPKPKKPEARPRLFGDRVRALEDCAPRPPCAAPVLRRADDVRALSVDELRALDGALERCLSRCR